MKKKETLAMGVIEWLKMEKRILQVAFVISLAINIIQVMF